MTTFRPPLSSAVRLTVPVAPLPFCSTSFAFTVVSAAALGGRRRRPAAAASISKLRNLVMYLLPQFGSTGPVLSQDVVSHHSTPDIGSRFPWGGHSPQR